VTPSTGNDSAGDRRPSLLVGGGPPRGITLSRQNSISSQTPAAGTDRPALRPGGGGGGGGAGPQPAHDGRPAADKTPGGGTTTTIGDLSDVAGETGDLEASAVSSSLLLFFVRVACRAWNAGCCYGRCDLAWCACLMSTPLSPAEWLNRSRRLFGARLLFAQ